MLVIKQISISAHCATAHPSPQLVELRQTELVGPVDDDRVGIGDVQPTLDDGGADQNIEFAFGESQHGFLQLSFWHLAVGDLHRSFRDDLADAIGNLLDALHPIVHEKHLAVAVEFPQNGITNQRFVIEPDRGLDGQAFFRRGIDGAEITHAGQAHVQGAGNGRGREGEHIHLRPHLFDALFVANAKALLLIHDQQSQVFELHIFG